MKKTLLTVIIGLFLISCSDDEDNNSYRNNGMAPNNDEYEVWHRTELYKEFPQIVNDGVTVEFMRNGEGAMGYVGIGGFNNMGEIIIYEKRCPNCWDAPYRTGRLFSQPEEPLEKYTCSNCKSEYDPRTGQAISGAAAAKKMSIVKYKIDKYVGDWYIITNHRFKHNL